MFPKTRFHFEKVHGCSLILKFSDAISVRNKILLYQFTVCKMCSVLEFVLGNNSEKPDQYRRNSSNWIFLKLNRVLLKSLVTFLKFFFLGCRQALIVRGTKRS
jgi:hypothetical protein